MIDARKSALLLRAIGLCLFVLLLPVLAFAATEGVVEIIDLTGHWAGILSVVIFVAAYSLVIGEEVIHLRKSKPVIIAAGLIWVLVAIAFIQAGDTERAHVAIRHDLLEFVELFLFLLAAMTFINTMEERGVFDVLRVWLVTQGFSLRKIFWITGGLAFVMSPVADNLTTAMLMATVAVAVGGTNTRFVAIACIVYQYRGGGQCRWRLQPLRRHHHANGLAKRHRPVPGVFCAVSPVCSQLAGDRFDSQLRHFKGATRADHRSRGAPARSLGGGWSVHIHDRDGRFHAQRAARWLA